MENQSENISKEGLANTMISTLTKCQMHGPTPISFFGHTFRKPLHWITASENVLETIEEAVNMPSFERPEHLENLLSVVSERKDTLENEKLLCDENGTPITNIKAHLKDQGVDTAFLESVA